MSSLDCDVLREILGRVDIKTLAKAACVSPQFCSIASKECFWEEACSLRCPSLQNPQLKHLISSLPGGFKKFYASCFSVINTSHEAFHSDSTFYHHDGILESYTASCPSSDLMWVVDVQYDKKPIFSKIVWGIPFAVNFPGWYLQSPFQIDIINLEGVGTDEDALPTITSVDEVGREGEIWTKLIENIELSWIVINKRTGEAANLSSWKPLAEQRNPTSRVKFVVRFSSLLPAVKCIVEMKCRFLATGGHTSLKMTELAARLEDMSGNDVNGSEGLRILERSLRYRGTNDRNRVFELQGKYLAARNNFKEYTTAREGHRRSVWIVSAIIACVSFHYLKYLLGIVVAKDEKDSSCLYEQILMN